MKFSKVAIAAIGYVIPEIEVTSEWIETELREVYERLKLPPGRLEGMSGIAARRIWKNGTRLSDCSIASCRNAWQAAGLPDRLLQEVGCLIHASVCREYLEPATACRVHHHLGLSESCWVYDVSNACLGIMNGAVQIAQSIEAGVIRAGMVVGTEDSRGLMRATLEQLRTDTGLTRQSIKPAFASLTIGSGSCAWLLVDRAWWSSIQASQAASPILGAVARARTQFHDLCQSDTDQAGEGMLPTMQTDSEQLLEAGVDTGTATFQALLDELGWSRTAIDATVCHQVGAAHRRRMLAALGMETSKDYANFKDFGNTGSVALPTAFAMAIEAGFTSTPSQVALLGIGSGVNSVMLGLDYRGIAVRRTSSGDRSST
ncbi:MAG: 3-oxoacyl-ACP synthase III [Pirellula sp.]|nr:3-oxoacyl-ACP synthase III [Pirellula sp.]